MFSLHNCLNVMCLFSTIFKVLVMVGSNSNDNAKAQGILYLLESFNFVFMEQLMPTIFGYISDLYIVLQRIYKDNITAMRLVIAINQSCITDL